MFCSIGWPSAGELVDAEEAGVDVEYLAARETGGGGEAVHGLAAEHGAEPRGKRTEQGEATYLVAIAEALWEEMERDERVFMLGEDIGVYGGAFKVTEGFIDKFGPARVSTGTPIHSESPVVTPPLYGNGSSARSARPRAA